MTPSRLITLLALTLLVPFGPRATASRAATHPPAPISWRRVTMQGLGCGRAFAAILVFRSHASLDFIYFHF